MLSETDVKVVSYFAEKAIACLNEIRETARGKDSNIESQAARRIEDLRTMVREAKL